MVGNLKYLTVNYTQCDNNYINDLLKMIDIRSKEVVEWFNFDDFGLKPVATIFDTKDKLYESALKRNPKEKIFPWICGFAFKKDGKNYIEVLSLEELKTTPGHEQSSLDDLCNLIVHEFTHACQQKIENGHNVLWLLEGMASYFGNQYAITEKKITNSLEQMITNSDGKSKYSDYKKMFAYVYETYGKEYCLELLKDREKAYNDTPRLYEETLKYYETALRR